MSILPRTPRVLVLAAVLAAAVPAAASATTRYVAPNGKSSGACDAAAPCSYTYVFKSYAAQSGDTVVMKEGTYDVGTAGLTIDRRLDVVADPNAASRPRIVTSLAKATAVTVGVLGWGTSLKGLDIEASSYDAATALDVAGTITASDLDLHCHYRCLITSANNARATLEDSKVSMGSGWGAVVLTTGGVVRRTSIDVDGGGMAAWLGKGSVLEDSVIHSDEDGALVFGGTVQRVAIQADRALNVSNTTLVRDSLLESTADYAAALDSTGAATVRNVTAIASGAKSFGLRAGTGIGVTGSIDARNVIARGVALDVDGEAASNDGFGCPCKAAPVEIAYSNFSTAGEAVIGHGHNQSADPRFVDVAKRDYRLRPGSPAIDAGTMDASVGPIDLAWTARKQGVAPDIGAFETKPLPKPADQTAPVLTKVKVRRKAPASVSFRLSEKATVKVKIRRKLKAGKPGKVRTLTFSGKKGPNSDPIAKVALQPGQFTFTLVATDAAKNKSKPVTRTLLVKAP